MDKFFCISTCLLTVMGTLLAPGPVMGDFINDRTLIVSEGVRHSSPALADLDGDGKLEIVVGSGANYIYAWHCDGRLVDGWPQKAQWRIASSPAVADLDGDGDMEVVAGGHVWRRNGVLADGWPHKSNDFCTPALADIDQDGDLEVIFANSENGLDIRHHDGRLVDGWPQQTNSYIRTTPTVGDIDGDGFPEIIAYSRDQHLYAWNHDGTLLAGWPVATTSRVEDALSLADIDGDGKLDHIVCGDGIYRPNGERIGERIGLRIKRAVPVDLNMDGDVDIVGMKATQSVAGEYLPGWPVRVYGSNSDGVGIADIDGDADLEVLWSSGSNFLYAFSHDGVPVSGWPRWLVEAGDSAPAIADIDGDGDIEIVLCTDLGRILIWDEPSPVGPHQIAWPMLSGGPKRAGVPELAPPRSFGAMPLLSHTQQLMARGDFASAIEAYRHAAADTANSQDQRAEAAISIARIYNSRLQDDESAFGEYESFIEGFPESPLLSDAFLEMSDIYRYRFLGLQFQDRFAGTTEQFRQILEANPDETGGARQWFLLGDAYEVLRDDRQQAVFEKIVNDYPDSYWAEISSQYLDYEGIAHHLNLEFWEDSDFSTAQTDIKEGDVLVADRSMIFSIYSFSPAKQPFPCQVTVTTGLEPAEILGPKYPFPRDPDLLVSSDDRSKVSGLTSQHELPNGDTVFTWDGALRSASLHAGGLGTSRITTTSQPGLFVSDISIERKYEKLGQDRQLCRVLVTSTWEPTVHIYGSFPGIIDTTTPIPEPTSAISDSIWWSSGSYRTEPEGIPETIEFSFIVQLSRDVGYAYPKVSVRPDSQTEQLTHPDVGKTLSGFECSFEGQTYEIASAGRFKVRRIMSTVKRKYRLDAIVVEAR